MSDRYWPPGTGPDLAMSDDWLTYGVPGRRILAFVLDVLLLTFLIMALWTALFLFGLVTLGLGFPLLGLLPAVPPLYHFLFLAGPSSATPGQSMMGLVVRRNIDLGRPDVLEALVCVVGFYATLALGAVLLIVALFTARRRTLHDIVSGLVVVRADTLPSVLPPYPTPPQPGRRM